MAVERIGIEEILGDPPKVVAMTAQPIPQLPSKEAEYSAILAAMQVAAKILAVRFFLFLSLVGSFVLAILAHNSQSTISEVIMIIYACVTTIPLVALEVIQKRG